MNKIVFIVEHSGDVSHLDYEHCNFLLAVTKEKADEIKQAQINTPDNQRFQLNSDGTWRYIEAPTAQAFQSAKEIEFNWFESEYESQSQNLMLHDISHTNATGTYEQVCAYMRELVDFSTALQACSDIEAIPSRPSKPY